MTFLLRLQYSSRLYHLHNRLSHMPQNIYNNTRRAFNTPNKKKVKKKKIKSTESEAMDSALETHTTAGPLAATALTTEDTGSSSKDWWRMKWYRFRRMSMMFGIPFAISTGLFALHDSDIPYIYCLKKLTQYPLPDDYDPSLYAIGSDNPPPNPGPTWAQTLPMIWAAQIHSHRPTRIMKQWKYFMPLLDKKYPAETRMVGIGCLMGMLSGDTNTLPPDVFFEKCLRKLEILQGYKSSQEDGGWTTERFLNMIYALCGETSNQQLLFAGLQLLLDFTSIPMTASPEAIKYIMDHTKDIAPAMREDIASSLMLIYQDPMYIVDFIKRNPPRPRQSSMSPDFMEIKKILIDNDCMKFAFSLLDAKSIQLKQLAMFILIGLVGNYPDIREIKSKLGETDDEKLQNGIKLVDSLAGIGQEHFQRGDNEAALGAFTEAIKYLPRSAQLLYLRGKCLAELGRIDAAKTQYRQAMAMTPAQSGPMSEATLQLCNLLIKHAKSREDLEEATEYLEMMIDQGTYHLFQTVEIIDIEDVYDRLNICLEKLGRFDDALDRMLALCKIKSNSHQIHFETGRMASKCKEYDLAREHLQYAVQLEPFDMFAKYHLAVSYFYLNQGEHLDKSRAELLTILQSKPNDEKCLSLLAQIHIAQNKWQDALGIYQSLASKKNTAYIQYQMGVAYEHLENEAESVKSFETSANLWLQYVNKIGYEQYFYNRPKEAKALQKIQSRCEHHRYKEEWGVLNQLIQQIGMN